MAHKDRGAIVNGRTPIVQTFLAHVNRSKDLVCGRIAGDFSDLGGFGGLLWTNSFLVKSFFCLG
jgi:hypothetical protein